MTTNKHQQLDEKWQVVFLPCHNSRQLISHHHSWWCSMEYAQGSEA